MTLFTNHGKTRESFVQDRERTMEDIADELEIVLSQTTANVAVLSSAVARLRSKRDHLGPASPGLDDSYLERMTE